MGKNCISLTCAMDLVALAMINVRMVFVISMMPLENTARTLPATPLPTLTPVGNQDCIIPTCALVRNVSVTFPVRVDFAIKPLGGARWTTDHAMSLSTTVILTQNFLERKTSTRFKDAIASPAFAILNARANTVT